MLLLMSRHAGSTDGQCRYVSLGTLADFLLNCLRGQSKQRNVSVVFEWDERKGVVNKSEGMPAEL